jgi:nucleoside-diphosphate-sugar epimerase
MNVLITGSAGFIGKYLLKELVANGHKCRCLLRNTENLDQIFSDDSIELFKGDVTKPETLDGIGKNIEIVYHLAAAGHVAAVSEQAQKSFFDLNVQGTKNLIEACGKNDVKRFFHFSSTAAMGLPDITVIDEKVLCNPVTPYQKSKYQSEIIAFKTGKEQGIEVIVLRPCMVYGPGGEGEFLKFCRLIKKGIFPRIGLGKNLTPIVHVEDVVQAAIKALGKAKFGELYLIASETSPRLADIQKLICEALNIKRIYFYVPLWFAYLAGLSLEKLSIINGKPPVVSRKNIISTTVDRIFDISKARRDFDYSPSMYLNEGISSTVSWYFKRGLL